MDDTPDMHFGGRYVDRYAVLRWYHTEYSASYCYTGRKKNVDLGNRADMSMLCGRIMNSLSMCFDSNP